MGTAADAGINWIATALSRPNFPTARAGGRNTAMGGYMNKATCVILVVGILVSSAFAAQPLKGLAADKPFPPIADKMALFGQFVGDWEANSVIYNPDGSKVTGKAEWHWGWILNGTALQDVYILRSSAGKRASRVIGIGTALRFPEAGTDNWRVVYVGPMKGYLYTFNARRVGDEIVLDGKNEDDAPMRWIFSKITSRAFHWKAVVSPDKGRSWQVMQEMSVWRSRL